MGWGFSGAQRNKPTQRLYHPFWSMIQLRDSKIPFQTSRELVSKVCKELFPWSLLSRTCYTVYVHMSRVEAWPWLQLCAWMCSLGCHQRCESPYDADWASGGKKWEEAHGSRLGPRLLVTPCSGTVFQAVIQFSILTCPYRSLGRHIVKVGG